MMNLKDSLQIDEIFFSIVFHLNRMILLNSMWSDSTEIIFDIFLFLSKWWKLSMVPYRLLSLLPLEMLVPKFKIFHLLKVYFYSSHVVLLFLMGFVTCDIQFTSFWVWIELHTKNQEIKNCYYLNAKIIFHLKWVFWIHISKTYSKHIYSKKTYFVVHIKGQLNSEWIHEVINSSKISTKNYRYFCPGSLLLQG